MGICFGWGIDFDTLYLICTTTMTMVDECSLLSLALFLRVKEDFGGGGHLGVRRYGKHVGKHIEGQ